MRSKRKLKNGLTRFYCPMCGAAMYDGKEIAGDLFGRYERVIIHAGVKRVDIVNGSLREGCVFICDECYNKAHEKAGREFRQINVREWIQKKIDSSPR